MEQENSSQLNFILPMWIIKEKGKSASNCSPRAEPPMPTENI